MRAWPPHVQVMRSNEGLRCAQHDRDQLTGAGVCVHLLNLRARDQRLILRPLH